MPIPQMPPQAGGFLAAAQGGQPPPPPPPQGAPPAQAGGQQPPPVNPQIIMQMLMQLPPQLKQMIIQQLMQSVAGQGRNGDALVAHLTPGEKTVPPEVQTPKVLATLNKAYKEKGVHPDQFTAGSPASSTNPSTGLPEYNFMSSFLPLALGIAGSALFPALAPGLMAAEAGGTAAAGAGLSALAGSSIGSGIGSTVGGLASGQKPMQALLSGAGSALGGYGLGSIGSGAGEAAKAGASGMTAGSNFASSDISRMADMFAGNNPASPLGATSANPEWTKLGGMLPKGFNPLQASGSTMGGYLGAALGAPVKSNSPKYPPHFNDPYTPGVGSWQDQLGMSNYQGPNPTFNNYNPAVNNPAAYNFFPTG